MAKASHTINGKGFEYACLCSLYHWVRVAGKDVEIICDKPYETAEKAFSSLGAREKKDMRIAANTATRLISPLEPMLTEGPGTLQLSISPDSVAIGTKGDVRDVICSRPGEGGDWTIGISCKHNHEGLRHPRITKEKDFGSDWMQVRCGDDFMNEITPVIDMLIRNEGTGVLWAQIERKHDDYYIPILEAYLREIRRMCNETPDVPERLLSYFFGANDFYKVIMRKGTTTVEGFNMHGTLNKSCGKTKPIIKVPILKMPTKILDADFKPKSKTTIILTFDGGWSISMRLHNKDKRARPTSLAWEVYLEGLPPSTYINTHTWD